MSVRLPVLAALLGGLALPAGAETFDPAEILAWERKSFAGETEYALETVAGRPAVRALCADSASGLFLERSIDLTQTPVIEWSWRVPEAFPAGPDEATKAGDDYPARLYVVQDGGLFPWQSRAVNYVWASQRAEGTDWPNAYAGQARMVAVRSGTPAGAAEEAAGWRTERRNIRQDFLRYHGRDVTAIDAIAIMTDCDDRNGRTQAWYGTIRLLPPG